MKKLPRITEILKIEPFKITCRWTTGEILVTDFERFFGKWKAENYQLMYPLFDFDTFRYASVSDSNTLQWLNVSYEFKNFDGQTTKTPLDLCPDVLYENSTPLKKYRLQLCEEADVEDLVC